MALDQNKLDILRARLQQNQSQTTAPAPVEKPFANKVTDFLGLDKATDVFGRALARGGVGTDTPQDVVQQYVPAPTGKELGGAVLQTAATVAAPAVAPAGLGASVLAGAGLGYSYDIGSDMIEDDNLSDILTPGAGTAFGAAGPLVGKGVGLLAGKGANAVSRGVNAVSEMAPGAKQLVKETAGRVPRIINNAKGAMDEAATRAATIEKASPAAKNAFQAGLDEDLIIGVQSSSPEAKSAFKRIVDVAETPSVGLRPKVRPESIAGETASSQYDLIEKQRKMVGQEIGKLSDELSSTTKLDTKPSVAGINDVLRSNNIIPGEDGTLGFVTKRLTDKQKTVVQRLYELATTDEALTPKQIHEYDQLFSKLQREARFVDQIDDIYLNVPTEKGTAEVNIFKVFRDIYSKQLDDLSPRMRELNREYRLVKNLQDDLDATIFKSGNFETTKNLDGAEFAQTNLRRLFSDAQSAADYRAIYDKLDSLSRSLGYTGARADELALFAQKLRTIYPETIPETSFQGGIKGVIDTVANVGKPTEREKQEALKKLLEEVNG